MSVILDNVILMSVILINVIWLIVISHYAEYCGACACVLIKKILNFD